MKRSDLFAVLVIGLAAPDLLAESATREFAGKWFLNPSTQNWTCATEPGLPTVGPGSGTGQCKSNFTSNLGFIRAYPTVRARASGTKYFVYVQEWGGAAGPGSECWGDSIMLFETPHSVAGAKADVAPIYRGVVTPPGECSEASPERSHWAFASVFHDNGFGATYLLGQRVRWDAAAPFTEIWVGESSPNMQGYDEGIHFTWSKLFGTTIPDHNVYGAYLIPDDGGLVWRGFLENSHPGGWGATPIIVDWLDLTIQYKTSATGWATIPVYGNMTGGLPYLQYHGFVSGYSFVRGRYELHFGGPAPKSGNRPLPTCPDNPYVNNNTGVTLPGRWDNGQQPYYLVVDGNFDLVQSSRNLTSTIYPLPADTGFSHGALSRVETLAGQTIYYGSQNWSLCNVALNTWNHWSGSGIRFGRVQEVP